MQENKEQDVQKEQRKNRAGYCYKKPNNETGNTEDHLKHLKKKITNTKNIATQMRKSHTEIKLFCS